MNDGGPAFPYEATQFTREGASLRDYFAARAMAAIISVDDTLSIGEVALKHGKSPADIIAMAAWNYADAMIKTRDGK